VESSLYIMALMSSRRSIDAIESALDTFRDGSALNTRVLRDIAHYGGVSDEDAHAAIHGLLSLGVIKGNAPTYTFDATAFAATEGLRRGIRLGLDSSVEPPDRKLRLVCTVPENASVPVRNSLLKNATELRAAIVSIITAAETDLVLASPYWDMETARDLAPLIGRRLQNCVRVVLLGRTESESSHTGRPLAWLKGELRGLGDLTVKTWYERSPDAFWGGRTFHFKAAIADNGTHGYLGTANFTTGGLRARFEIGVLLEGPEAEGLARLLEVALDLAGH